MQGAGRKRSSLRSMGKRRRRRHQTGEEVIRLVEEPNDFTYAYELDGTIEDKLNQIVQKIYGGKRAVLTANAQKQAKQLEDLDSATARSAWQRPSTA